MCKGLDPNQGQIHNTALEISKVESDEDDGRNVAQVKKKAMHWPPFAHATSTACVKTPHE